MAPNRYNHANEMGASLDSSLLIGGSWVGALNGKTFGVQNPATGEEIGRAADGGADETQSAIDAAVDAFAGWSSAVVDERSSLLKRFSYRLREPQVNEDLAFVLSLENGKPLAEARAEIERVAEFFEWDAEQARRTYGQTIPTRDRKRRVMTLRRPLGVVAAITAWNFPLYLVGRKLAAALAAGCTVVVKPAKQAPLSVARLFQYLDEWGLPPGVANLITNQPILGSGGRADVESQGEEAEFHRIYRSRQAVDGCCGRNHEESQP